MIELVIALMIAAIVISIILFFLNTASKGFQLTNDDVNLQMEAQIIINQLSNLAMEAKEMEEYSDTEEKRFIFKYDSYERDDIEEYYTSIIFRGNSLYQLSSEDEHEAREGLCSEERHMLAEYIKNLHIEESSNGAVVIELALELGKDSVSKSKKVKLRNAR